MTDAETEDDRVKAPWSIATVDCEGKRLSLMRVPGLGFSYKDDADKKARDMADEEPGVMFAAVRISDGWETPSAPRAERVDLSETDA